MPAEAWRYLPVRLPGELRSSPPEMRGVLAPRLCFMTLMVVGVATGAGMIWTAGGWGLGLFLKEAVYEPFH